MIEILKVDNLALSFPVRGGIFKRKLGAIHAVRNLSFSLEAGETLGIVGESGCGKTSLGRTIVRLYEPSEGRIVYKGQDLSHMKGDELKGIRRDVQMIFQDPYSSLNPRMSVLSILEEPLRIHHIGNKSERLEKILSLIELVGLSKTHLKRFPHEFSGGQRQRIAIARALMLEPKLLIADEPVSALDVSIQSQILNLLVDLQKKLNLTVLFISHDLMVVKYIADRIAVMYLGKIVEIGPSEQVFSKARHPYTEGLLESIPSPDPTRRKLKPKILGDLPSPREIQKGCPFHSRCPRVMPKCLNVKPLLEPKQNGLDNHHIACHLHESKT